MPLVDGSQRQAPGFLRALGGERIDLSRLMPLDPQTRNIASTYSVDHLEDPTP